MTNEPGQWVYTDDLGYGVILENRQDTLLVRFDLAEVELDVDGDYEWTDLPDFSGQAGWMAMADQWFN